MFDRIGLKIQSKSAVAVAGVGCFDFLNQRVIDQDVELFHQHALVVLLGGVVPLLNAQHPHHLSQSFPLG